MYNQILRNELDKYHINDINDLSFSLREIGQKVILFALAKSDAFKHIAFYGGTALRIFRHLDRYSEDLDFALLDDFPFSLNEAEPFIVEAFKEIGITIQISKKENYDDGVVMRRYIKFLLFDIANEYFPMMCPFINKEENISIKIEIDKSFYGDYKCELLDLDFPSKCLIKTFDMPTLFASKIPAILFRNWKIRVKGRDFYDYLFYINQGASINIDYLKFKLNNFELSLIDLKGMLLDRFNNVNFKYASMDVLPFVKNVEDVLKWNKELFIDTLDKLSICHISPNKETVNAMNSGEFSKAYNSIDQLFDDLSKKK